MQLNTRHNIIIKSKRKGKQIRPILIFLIAKMLVKITDKTYNSHIRRGNLSINLSINALWKK